ncbi:MAG: tetratricopeptide repeat protein, partial [Pseudomonadota bacterium]
ALADAGADPFPRIIRARMHFEAGRPAQAERLLSEAAARRPSDGLLWLELGNLRLEIGDAAGAAAAFERAARAWRNWSFARVGRTRALTARGKAVAAARELRAFLESRDLLPRERAWARAALGEALLAQGKGFATSARAEARAALDLWPDLPLALVVHAAASDALGDSATAASLHERVEAVASHLPSGILARARHLAASSPERAASAYRRYLELLPRGPAAAEARRFLARVDG